LGHTRIAYFVRFRAPPDDGICEVSKLENPRNSDSKRERMMNESSHNGTLPASIVSDDVI